MKSEQQIRLNLTYWENERRKCADKLNSTLARRELTSERNALYKYLHKAMVRANPWQWVLDESTDSV